MALLSDALSIQTSPYDDLNALLNVAPNWNYLTGNPSNVIYYTYDYTFTDLDGGVSATYQLFDAQKASVEIAIAYIETITGIDFQLTADATLANVCIAGADIIGSQTAGLCAAGASYSYNESTGEINWFDVQANVYLDMNEFYSVNIDLTPGTAGYEILLHELGHMLGLDHPFEGNYLLPESIDNTDNTVMSYTDAGAIKDTFQEFDLAALEWIYGGDGLGGTEGINSTNGPSLSPLEIQVAIDGLFTEDEVLSLQLTGSSATGTYVVQWYSDGTALAGETSETLLLSQAHVGKNISAAVYYTDWLDRSGSFSSLDSVDISNLNDLPTGEVSILGEFLVGAELSAVNTLSDEDGLGVISYQWNRDGEAIVGADQANYNVSELDIGSTLTVSASYTDLWGSVESVTSAGLTRAATKLLSADSLVINSGQVVLLDESGEHMLAGATLSPTSTFITAAEYQEQTHGALEISDVIAQLRHIVGLDVLTGLAFGAADNDGNGEVAIGDVISSLRQIVGLETAPNAKIVTAEGDSGFLYDNSLAELYVVAPGDADLSWTPSELV